MKISYSLDNLNIKNPVVTIGTFDGLHKGHIEIMKTLKRAATKYKGESVVVTFCPHPRQVISPNKKMSFINTIDEKIERLSDCGIDNLIILPFTKKLSQQTSSDFIKNILFHKLKTKHLIVGYDHKFGNDRQGDLNKLKQYSIPFGFDIEKVGVFSIDNINVSSTKIRNAIAEGNIELANNYLGYKYSITGKVIKGKKIGRTINFPTANINPLDSNKLIPANGVYAVSIKVKENTYNGMLNIGINPTISKLDKPSIEVNIFDFSENIYSEIITIYLLKFIRKETTFSNLNELKLQLYIDKDNAIKDNLFK